MASFKTRSGFAETIEGQEIKRKLEAMAEDSNYNTQASYNANGVLYPDNSISFVDKHMNYLITHPALEPSKYLANVRLLTRVR